MHKIDMSPKSRSSLTPLDLIAISSAGVLGIVVVGRLGNAPLMYTAMVALGFIAAIVIYAQVTKSRTHPQTPPAENAAISRLVTADFPLAEGFTEAILTIGARGQIIYANPAALTLFRFTTMGQPYAQIIHEPSVKAMISEALKGTTPEPVSYQIEAPVSRHLRATVTPILTDPDIANEQRVLVVFHDITDLVIDNTLRSDFLANASHELKTPVASILGYIETLRGHARDDAPARERFLVIMQEQAERMQRLITDLLSLRRIELIEHRAPTETSDLLLAVKPAIEAVEPLAKERGVKLSMNNTKPIPVIGVQDELVQICVNLIDNAVKMSPEGSAISVSLESTNGEPGAEFSKTPISADAAQRCIVEIPQDDAPYGIIRIRDEGTGFAPQHLPRLAERFYRIAGDRTSREKGTGLGLAIVKHIVRRHRGALFIESAEGTGTEFSIFIPAARDN